MSASNNITATGAAKHGRWCCHHRPFGRKIKARGDQRCREPGWLAGLVEAFDGGTLGRTFTIRLMICIGAAGVVTEVLPLARSYWVPLTVAIVLRPDYGSVFAPALQRGIGTIVGAVAGAVLLVLLHGTWLLIPFAVLAARAVLAAHRRDRLAGPPSGRVTVRRARRRSPRQPHPPRPLSGTHACSWPRRARPTRRP
jgi:Fusaric acid resistance protein-like